MNSNLIINFWDTTNSMCEIEGVHKLERLVKCSIPQFPLPHQPNPKKRKMKKKEE